MVNWHFRMAHGAWRMAHGVCHVWRTSTTMASEASARLLIMRLAWARVSERVSEFSTAALSGVPDKTQSLSEALGGLQLLERAVVHLAHSAYSRQEIANILGISCESVDDRLATRQRREGSRHPALRRPGGDAERAVAVIAKRKSATFA